MSSVQRAVDGRLFINIYHVQVKTKHFNTHLSMRKSYIERFQVRRNHPIKNHVFCALKAFVKLELMRFNQLITHWYEVKRDLFVKVIRDFICGEPTQEN